MLKQRNLLKICLLILIILFSVRYNSYAQSPAEEALKKGTDYGRHGSYNEAISEFNKAIEASPGSASAYYDRGFVYDKKENLDQAISDYTKAIEIDPNFTDAYYNRGFAYYKKGTFDLAISDYSKVIELSPSSPDAYYGRGLVYSKKGNLNEAISDYTKAIEVRPNFALAYDARAVAYFAKKDYIKSLADVNKAGSLGFRSRPLKETSSDLINSGKNLTNRPEKGSGQGLNKNAGIGLAKIAFFSIAILFGACLIVFFILRKSGKR